MLQKDKSRDKNKNKNNDCERDIEREILAREGECFAALQTQVKYEVRYPKFIWAPCHVMCTAVLIG